MELFNLILTSALLVTYIGVSIYQHGKIRELKAQLTEQRGLINDNKTTLDGMKSLFETYKSTFEIGRLKDYTDMRVETVKGQAANLVADDVKVKEMAIGIMDKQLEPVIDFYIDQMGVEHWELVVFACNVLIQNRGNKTNLEYILNALPNTKDKLLYIVNEKKGLDLEDITLP